MNDEMMEVFFAGKDAQNCIDNMPLGMAYVPMQKWTKVYDADVALERGTIFPDLDKPFLGKEAFL